MAVLIDDRPYEAVIPDMTVQQLAQEVCARPAAEARRAVLEIRCDGRTISDAELDAVLASPVGSFSRLELQTGPLTGLAAATLQLATDELAEAAAARERLTDLLGQGEQEAAFALLRRLLEAWRQSQQAAQLAAEAFDVQLSKLSSEGCGFDEALANLKSKLGDLRDAITSGDMVLVSDIVRYELDEPLGHWLALLPQIRPPTPG